MYKMNEKEKQDLSKKVKSYVDSEFSYNKTISLWHESMVDTIENWKSSYTRWSMEEK